MTLLSFNIFLVTIFVISVMYVVIVYMIDRLRWPELPINSFFQYTNSFPVCQAIWVVVILNWILQIVMLTT